MPSVLSYGLLITGLTLKDIEYLGETFLMGAGINIHVGVEGLL